MNKLATEQVKQLVEQQPKILECNTVEIYHIPSSFLACTKATFSFQNMEIEPSGEEILMIPGETRSILLNLFEEVIERRKKELAARNRTLLIGTPGIGKSFSSSYFIRVLMKNKVPFIVFETQKTPDRYLIALRDKNDSNSGYDVYSVSEDEFMPTAIPQLKSFDSWYICDHAGSEGRPIAKLINCSQFCFSSPADSNYKEWKKDCKKVITLPPPTELEVEEMFTFYQLLFN